MITALVLLQTLCLITVAQAFCGDNIKWSHNVNIEHVYGMWYGAGYARHSPDLTDRPEDIGCVTLYITEADDFGEMRLDWTHPRRDYNQQRWLSPRNNPYSETGSAGSWLDSRFRLKRRAKRALNRKKNNTLPLEGVSSSRAKRDIYGQRRLKVIWDEDGQSMEQTYVYSKDEPGLWTAEHWRPMEREMLLHGVDMYYHYDPPRHPEVIRILKITFDQLIINHCSDSGGGGIFSLILRRSPNKVGYWDWYELQKQFYDFELPAVYRKAPVCAACLPVCTEVLLFICTVIAKYL